MGSLLLTFGLGLLSQHALASPAEFCDPAFGYCLSPPDGFGAIWHPSVGMTGDMIEHKNASADGKYSIDTYHQLLNSCKAIGVAAPFTGTLAAGGTFSWGRVDFYDWFKPDSTYYPKCVPLAAAYESENEHGEALHWPGRRVDGSQSYAFCAENDNKAVLICFNQMQDNPSLAKQVFSTFRWLDGSEPQIDAVASHSFGNLIANAARWYVMVPVSAALVIGLFIARYLM